MISSCHDPDCHLPLKSTCSLWGKGERGFTNNIQNGRNLQHQTPTTHLPDIPRAQPGPPHLLQRQSHHWDGCAPNLPKHNQPGLSSALCYFHTGKRYKQSLSLRVQFCLWGPPLQCRIPPQNRSNHFAFHVLHPALISSTKGSPTSPVHLASWLHWNMFWSKFTHDYHLSAVTGKL